MKCKKILASCTAFLLVCSLSGCFDTRKIDLEQATVTIPKPMMRFKVGEAAIQTELYIEPGELAEEGEDYDFYVGMVKDTYGQGPAFQKKAESEGKDRYLETTGKDGDMYTEGYVFGKDGQNVLLTCAYEDPEMESTLTEIFNSIQLK